MQPDIPWNVAGIPAEVREAARAAARREGLSLGEWLTRHILKSASDPGIGEAWDGPPDELGTPQSNGHDSGASYAEGLIERIAQSEADARAAARRFEDQLRTFALRLDATERTQSDNSRAVNQAAAEISIASREQTEAFDKLGRHVAALGDRLTRIERNATGDGVKDAVKGLHSGLSRLADQIAETASQSANQIAAVSRNVDSVTDKLNDVRSEATSAQRALTAKVQAFEDRIRNAETIAQSTSEKLEKTITDANRINEFRAEAQSAQRALTAKLQSVEDRARTAETAAQAAVEKLEKSVADVNRMTDYRAEAASAQRALTAKLHAIDDRVTQNETAAQAATARLDKAVAEIEAVRNQQRVDQIENQRESQLVTQLSDALDRLSARLTAGEAQTAGAFARIENQIGAFESRRAEAPVERRLQSVEHTLSDISGRLEKTERNASGAVRTIEENFRTLSARLDAAEQGRREAVVPTKQVATAVPPPEPLQRMTPAPLIDEPAVVEAKPPHPVAAVLAEPPLFHAAADSSEEPLTLDTIAPDTPILAEALSRGLHKEPPPKADGADAKRTADADVMGLRVGLGFAGAARKETEKEKTPLAHYVLMGGIAVISVAAVVAGVLLSHGIIGNMSTVPAPIERRIAVPAPPMKSIPAKVAALPKASAPSTAPGATSASTSPLAPPLMPATPPAATAQSAKAPTIAHLTQLANAGNAKAELIIGLKNLDGDGVAINEAEAAKWLERAAGKGEAIAAYRLGTLYERGHGVPADSKKALHWYAVAAGLGNRKAMHNLAVAYAEGSGTPKDLRQAAQWFAKAAALGLGDSEFNLAVLYERGMGVQQSLIDAYKWYAIAAGQGDSESKARLDVIATQLSADERAAAQRAASEFHPLPLDRNANVPPDPSAIG